MTEQEKMVLCIEWLLKEAKEGKINAFAYVGLYQDNRGFHGGKLEPLQAEIACMLKRAK